MWHYKIAIWNYGTVRDRRKFNLSFVDRENWREISSNRNMRQGLPQQYGNVTYMQ